MQISGLRSPFEASVLDAKARLFIYVMADFIFYLHTENEGHIDDNGTISTDSSFPR